MQVMFYGAAAFDRDLGWCVDENIVLTGAFAGTKCAGQAAEDEYFYTYDFLGEDFLNEAEAVALAKACGLTVLADLAECPTSEQTTYEPTPAPTLVLTRKPVPEPTLAPTECSDDEDWSEAENSYYTCKSVEEDNIAAEWDKKQVPDASASPDRAAI